MDDSILCNIIFATIANIMSMAKPSAYKMNTFVIFMSVRCYDRDRRPPGKTGITNLFDYFGRKEVVVVRTSMRERIFLSSIFRISLFDLACY